MKRSYEVLLRHHFDSDTQMAFVCGPRQVGKTTTCQSCEPNQMYLNWDHEDHRRKILSGPAAVAADLGLAPHNAVVFDQIHKYPDWRNFIKGFFDVYGRSRLRIVVTGSAHLDVVRKGADSLLGRYFPYRMHPLSIGEIANSTWRDRPIGSPSPISDADYEALLRFGGFPDPFLKRNQRFHNRWTRMRQQLLFREDLRDTSRIYEIGQVELLAEFLRRQAGQLLNVATLSTRVRASQDSIRRWIAVLEGLYYCFRISPWSNNIGRSLLKEPKVYLWDWSTLDTPGARHENLVAVHLLKAIHWWQDTDMGDFGLYFLRTKDQREVDFLITQDTRPYALIEVKTSEQQTLSGSLAYFQRMTGAPHAFQVVMEADYAEMDCFDLTHPVKVPARTLLSQLV